ncbi:MAG TPA: hypothetical protein PKD85_00900 [Saprospiraceae bacterium]|nr:hypothetical protein [Saprospiraceae bacterium]
MSRRKREKHIYEVEANFIIQDKEWNVKFVTKPEIYYGMEEAITNCKDEMITLLEKYRDDIGDMSDNNITVSFKKIKTEEYEDSE